MSIILKKIKSFPNSTGVYIFRDKNRNILYVGKATSLRDRVSSYFLEKKGYVRPIEIMISEVADVEIRKTDTVLEAYILEQNLIKYLQPKYNVDGKDDKSFSYVLLTREDFPRFVIIRKTDLALIQKSKVKSQNDNSKLKIKKIITNTKYQIQYTKIYGPYTSKKSIEIVLKILRKIFPYHNKSQKSEKGCLDFQIGLCPGPYADAISKENYRKNIRGIRMILEGKKKYLLVRMKREMGECSKNMDYEGAAKIRNQIFALQHIQDIALTSYSMEHGAWNNENTNFNSKRIRIEGYDISNISGKYSVGSMVVFDNSEGELASNKNEYRKFKIKTIEGANDVGAMEEVLYRRFRNNWPRPNLILLDGGAGHLNMARKVLRSYKLEIPLLAVAKGQTRKKLDLREFGNVPNINRNIFEQIRDEAHRFAISYHRKLRSNNFTA